MNIARAALMTLAVLAATAARASDFSQAGIGTAGSEFLLFDQGARGIAMGQAYSAVTDDAFSMYWNPAGLAKIPRLSAGFMYSQYLQDISYGSAFYAQRVNDESVAGAGVRYQDLGKISQTDISGNDTGQFHPSNFVAELSWGQSLYDLSDSEAKIDMGVTARWMHSVIIEHADGFGADLGVQTRFFGSLWPYDLAAVLQNMGSGQKFDRVRNTLPLRAKFGGALRPRPELLVSAEMGVPIDNQPYGAAGLEYTLEVQKGIKAMLRCGLNSQNIPDLGILSALSAGVGLTISDFTFDYAFTTQGLLGQTHQLSITFNLPAKMSRRYRER